MAINLAGSGQALDGSLPTIYSEFRLLYDEMGVAKSTATKMRLNRHEGASKNINNYGRVVAYNVDDGVDLAQAQDLTDTTTSYTPGEVGVQVILAGSTMRRVQDPDLLERTGRMLANAYDLKQDADGVDQYASFTNGIGAAADILSAGHIFAGRSRVRVGNDRANPEPFPGPYYYVGHPLSMTVMAGRLIPFTDVPTGTNDYDGTGNTSDTVGAGRTSLGDDILRNGPGTLGQIGGVILKEDANIDPDANDDAVGGLYSKEGFIFVEEVEPTMATEEDASMRDAVELNLWGSYTWGLYRAGASGVSMTHDASFLSA